jgi:hypothetical protein
MEEKKEKLAQKEEKIGQALLKVALGYQIAEVTEEYAEVDGELKLTKRKKTKKDVPPDLKAVQLLLSSDGVDFAQWSDEELETEKQRLLLLLQEKTATKAATKKTVKASAVKKAKAAKAVGTEETAAGKKPRPKPRKRVVRKATTEN